MKKSEVLNAWASILAGQKPSLSIEITRECPLRCPGCYAYEPEHLGTGGSRCANCLITKGTTWSAGCWRSSIGSGPSISPWLAATPWFATASWRFFCPSSRAAAFTCSWSPAPFARCPKPGVGSPS